MSGVILSEAQLLSLAGKPAYQRGLALFKSGNISKLSIQTEKVTALVEGTSTYRVSLTSRSTGVDYQCDCPVGQRGDFCKHAVAVALALQGESDDAATIPADSDQTIRNYLAQLPLDNLLDIIIEQCDWNPVLKNKLAMRAAKQGNELDIKALKKSIRKGFSTGGFVEYRRMRGFLQKAVEVENLLSELASEGQYSALQLLSHYAMECGIKAYENTDDSGGGFGGILQQIAYLHLQAHQQGEVKREPFAKQLLKLMLIDGWGFFFLADYQPILGDEGMAELSKQAQTHWDKVSTKEAETECFQYSNITRLMEALATLKGNLDALIAIKSRSLNYAYDYLKIAELLRDAKRNEEAFLWAKRGQKAFPGDTDQRLNQFLVTHYLNEGQHALAMELAWENYVNGIRFEDYKYLKWCAEQNNGWSLWRDKVFIYLEAQKKKKPSTRFAAPPYRGEIVDIYLSEGDVLSALEEVKAHGLYSGQQTSFARACEAEYPSEAAAIYRGMAEKTVSLGNNQAYQQAIDLVGQVASAMERAGENEQYQHWLDALRVKHKAKRNFMKLMDQLS